MDWTQFAIFFISVVGLWFWNRSENRSDLSHMNIMLQANRELIREVHKEIMMEMKDFHGKLCAIEERNRK